MGFIKDVSNQPNRQTFPGSTYEVVGEVPDTQCAEAIIESVTARSQGPPQNRIIDDDKFIGFNLIGKVCTIIETHGGNLGDFNIIANADWKIEFDSDPGPGNPCSYYVHDGGSLILTRNLPSFASYINATPKHLSSPTGSTTDGLATVTEAGKFTIDYAGATVELINALPADVGKHLILSNTVNVLTTDHVFNDTNPNSPYVIEWTIQHPYTIKGGKLYTSIPELDMQPACSILFDPIS